MARYYLNKWVGILMHISVTRPQWVSQCRCYMCEAVYHLTKIFTCKHDTCQDMNHVQIFLLAVVLFRWCSLWELCHFYVYKYFTYYHRLTHHIVQNHDPRFSFVADIAAYQEDWHFAISMPTNMKWFLFLSYQYLKNDHYELWHVIFLFHMSSPIHPMSLTIVPGRYPRI